MDDVAFLLCVDSTYYGWGIFKWLPIWFGLLANLGSCLSIYFHCNSLGDLGFMWIHRVFFLVLLEYWLTLLGLWFVKSIWIYSCDLLKIYTFFYIKVIVQTCSLWWIYFLYCAVTSFCTAHYVSIYLYLLCSLSFHSVKGIISLK